MQAIHFLTFKQLFSLGRRGLQLTEECSQAVCTQLGLFHISPMVSFGKQMYSSASVSASAFVGLTADQEVKP